MPDETYYEKAYDLTEDETKDFYAKWAATYDEELVAGNGYIQPERCGDAMERFVGDRTESEKKAIARQTGVAVAIIVIAIMGVLMDIVLRWLESKLIPWRGKG